MKTFNTYLVKDTNENWLIKDGFIIRSYLKKSEVSLDILPMSLVSIK